MQPDDTAVPASRPKRPRRQGRRDFGSIASHGPAGGPPFSATWLEDGKKRRRRGFETREKAAAFLARTRVELDSGERRVGDPVVAEGISIGEAITAYGKFLTDKGLRARPITDRLYRLRVFFPDRALLLSDLTTAKCAGYYEALRGRVSEATGKPYSVDSHRSMLAEARMLGKFCVSKRWLRANVVEGVQGKGRRRHGKPQLRIDEARRWLATAVGPTRARRARSRP
jgi:hypothetical protein